MTLATVCRRSLRALGVCVCIGLFLQGAVSIAWAVEPVEVPQALRAPTEGSPGSAAGLRVFIDPLTGEFTTQPTAQQAGELAAAIAAFRLEQRQDPNWNREGLRRFELSGGGTGVFLDGRFLTSTVVRRGPDGTFHVGCTRDPQTDPHTHPDNPAAHGAAPVK